MCFGYLECTLWAEALARVCREVALGTTTSPHTWEHTGDVDVSPVGQGRPEGEQGPTDWRLYFDGGARVLDVTCNGRGGWLLFRPDGLAVHGEAGFFGTDHATNNTVELAMVHAALVGMACHGVCAHWQRPSHLWGLRARY